ncbi:MAG TPA: hypothetical protein GXZ93_01820 [Actinobacteria bacterium]|nr:hypothetical protein [Actinomycetota bacterium]
MKKLIIFFTVVVMVIFFSIPSTLLAETGDQYTYAGEDNGQYQVDITGDGDYEPDTNVYCIDDEIYLSEENSAYEETDSFVSDVMQNDGEGGNLGPGIDEVNAVAVEILATTASGGTGGENQEAVWDIISNDLDETSDENSQIIANAVMEVAEKFVNLPENNDDDETNDVSLQEFLDNENINELKIVLDSDPLVDPATMDTNTFEAEAIMENPLVPTITDEGKTVFWYIMEGSYNVSFSETDLVLTASSTMSNKLDDADAEDTVDNDGDGDIIGDNYGYSSIRYYYYWWGEGYPEFEEMNVNLFAWVDIDEDCKLDIQDIATSTGNDPDGDVVGDFINSHRVIATQDNPDYDNTQPSGPYNSPHIIVDENNDGIADTIPITGIVDFEMDVHKQVGGKVLEAEPKEIKTKNPNVCSNGYWHNDHYWKCRGHNHSGGYYRSNSSPICDNGYFTWTIWGWYWNCRGHDHSGAHEKYTYTYKPYQRFVIQSYDEPFAGASQSYEARGSFEFIKTDSSTGLPVAGATYLLSYTGGQTFEPDVKEFVLVTDADGKASVSGLPWGTYTLQETSAPAGYLVDPNVYTYHIGGNALFVEDDTNVLDAYDEVTNDPIPPIPPVPPSNGGGETFLSTAGITEESEGGGGIQVLGIQVLGIQELPFTGTHYIIMLIGVSMIITACTILAVMRKRQTSK